MKEVQDLKKSLWGKVVTKQNDRLKGKVSAKFDEVLNYLSLDELTEQIKQKTAKIIEENNILREQVELLESEKIEFEEGDLKSIRNTINEIMKEEPSIQQQINAKKEELFKIYSQGEGVITQMQKYRKKYREIPAVKKAYRKSAKSTLQNQTLTLNAVKQKIEDCNKQEEKSITRVADIEKEISDVLAKSEKMVNLVNVEKTLADKVVQYEEQVISDIRKEIEKVKMNISDAENVIKERNEINNNSTIDYSNLSKKLRDEQGKDKYLHDELQSISKLRNDIIFKKISPLAIETNEHLKDLADKYEYKNQKEKMLKLAADKAKISKNVQETVDSKNESAVVLEKLKDDIKKDEELMRLKKGEIMSLEQSKDDLESELVTLNGEKLNLSKVIETNDKEKELIKSEIKELMTNYKEISKLLHSAQKNNRGDSDLTPLKESQVKAIDGNASVNNNKKNVNKWLSDLPPEFTRDMSRFDILSQNSTVTQENSNLNMQVSTFGRAESKNSTIDNDVYDLEIEDPEIVEANMDYSLSELNGSEICLDDSNFNIMNI